MAVSASVGRSLSGSAARAIGVPARITARAAPSPVRVKRVMDFLSSGKKTAVE
jgi:hypothetical protein